MLRKLLRRSAVRWFQTGSQPWAVVAVLAAGLLLWKRITGRTEEIVHREVLQPGTTLIVSAPTEPA